MQDGSLATIPRAIKLINVYLFITLAAFRGFVTYKVQGIGAS